MKNPNYLHPVNDSRILSVAAPGASTWVSATAFDAATTIPNDAYKSAARFKTRITTSRYYA